MLKKLLHKLLFFCLFLALSNQALAQTPSEEPDYSGQAIHIFASKTCPHCTKEKEFLKSFKKEHPALKIYHYDVAYPQNSQLLTAVAYALNVKGGGVPLTVIGDEFTIGYSESATEGKIIQMLDNQLRYKEPDMVTTVIKESNLVPIIDEFNLSEILSEEAEALEKESESENKGEEYTEIKKDEIDLPLFGRIDLKKASLPILTLMLGFLDGFNPCAMWVLMFLISLLLGIKDRKRMWILGFAFIISSAIVYFLFMAAWLNLFLFIGLVTWVRILIALLAVGVGVYYLRDYVNNKNGACEVDLGGRKQRIFARLKKITYRENLLWALVGIVLLAFAVNLLELLCSAGLPAIYTEVLAINDLTTTQHYLYLLAYIFIFMLDDIVIFVVAMFSLKAIGVNGKYARLSHLIGGILMLLIGLAMIFKPELIMFG